MQVQQEVASFTDAWIETVKLNNSIGRYGSHLLQMRGLKPFSKASEYWKKKSHLLQMRGLKLFIFEAVN